MKILHEFSLRHYIYINALLGDITLRQIISEQFPNNKWDLATEEGSGEFTDSFHHICKTKKGITQRWCSVDAGIQDLNIHGHDTLCQSYSVLYYMNGIKKTDKKLTRELQIKMINTWRKILNNTVIQGQIIFSAKSKTKRKEYIILPHMKIKYRTNRNPKKLISEIRKVLKEWEDYGYLWFMLKHTGNTSTQCEMCDQGVVEFSEDDII